MSDETAPPADDEEDDEAPLAVLATVKDLGKWMPEGIVAAYGGRPVWFLLKMDAELVTVFEQIPEDPMPKGKVLAILSGLRKFATERNAELQQLLGPTDSIELGFHVDASLSRVIEAFEEDGFHVLEEILVDGEVDLTVLEEDEATEDVASALGPPRELVTAEEIAALLRMTKTVAVLGIKTEEQADQPAFYVAEYAVKAGLTVFPVPVYYPDVTTILGRSVTRTVAAIGETMDLVNVFRRPTDLPPHLPDLLAAKPRAVWFQQGIRNDAVASELVKAGIYVVQDRCLLVELRALGIGGLGIGSSA